MDNISQSPSLPSLLITSSLLPNFHGEQITYTIYLLGKKQRNDEIYIHIYLIFTVRNVATYNIYTHWQIIMPQNVSKLRSLLPNYQYNLTKQRGCAPMVIPKEQFPKGSTFLVAFERLSHCGFTFSCCCSISHLLIYL